MIGTVTGIVLVFIVRVELRVFTQAEKATRIQRRCAPFIESALVEELCAKVRSRVIRTDRDTPFDRHPVAIPPSEIAVRPIEVSPVPVRDE